MFWLLSGDFGQAAGQRLEVTDEEDFVTTTVDRRELKPSVQLRSPFLNMFGSSLEDVDKWCVVKVH